MYDPFGAEKAPIAPDAALSPALYGPFGAESAPAALQSDHTPPGIAPRPVPPAHFLPDGGEPQIDPGKPRRQLVRCSEPCKSHKTSRKSQKKTIVPPYLGRRDASHSQKRPPAGARPSGPQPCNEGARLIRVVACLECAFAQEKLPRKQRPATHSFPLFEPPKRRRTRRSRGMLRTTTPRSGSNRASPCLEQRNAPNRPTHRINGWCLAPKHLTSWHRGLFTDRLIWIRLILCR